MLLAANFTQTIMVSEGSNVSLTGFTVQNQSGIAILNQGNLTLRDMNLLTDGAAEQLYNSGNGQVTLRGACNLELD